MGTCNPLQAAVAAACRIVPAGTLLLSLESSAAEPRVDPRFVLSQSDTFPAPAENQATLYVVREQHARVGPVPVEVVFLDSLPLGFLPAQTWLAAKVEPGVHRIWGISACPVLKLELRPGRSYLLRLREVIDENDHRTVSLIFEDPALLPQVVRRGAMLSTPTEHGLIYLQKRSKRGPDGRDPSIDATLTSLELKDVLCERPLDQVNLRTDFGQHTGNLSIDTVAIRYTRRFEIRTSFTSGEWVGDSLEVRPSDILQVRFGGTRFAGTSPWVSLIVRVGDGQGKVSFADLRDLQGVDTYNRIFAALQEVAEWSRARGSNDETAASRTRR